MNIEVKTYVDILLKFKKDGVITITDKNRLDVLVATTKLSQFVEENIVTTEELRKVLK